MTRSANTVFRMEDSSGRGVYARGLGTYHRDADDVKLHQPEPLDELDCDAMKRKWRRICDKYDLSMERNPYIFGWKDLDQLNDWFTISERLEIVTRMNRYRADDPILLREYIVSSRHVMCFNKQIVFNRSVAKLSDRSFDIVTLEAIGG